MKTWKKYIWTYYIYIKWRWINDFSVFVANRFIILHLMYSLLPIFWTFSQYNLSIKQYIAMSLSYDLSIHTHSIFFLLILQRALEVIFYFAPFPMIERPRAMNECMNEWNLEGLVLTFTQKTWRILLFIIDITELLPEKTLFFVC